MADKKYIPKATIEGARLIWRNFEGLKKRYNDAGDRNFSIKLDPDTANALRRDGWIIKVLPATELDREDLEHLKVKVNFDSFRPPRIFLVSSRGMNELTADEMRLMDVSEFSNVDLIINPSPWTKDDGSTGVTAYLEEMYATLEESDLGRKYADRLPQIAQEVVPEQSAGRRKPRFDAVDEAEPNF